MQKHSKADARHRHHPPPESGNSVQHAAILFVAMKEQWAHAPYAVCYLSRVSQMVMYAGIVG